MNQLPIMFFQVAATAIPTLLIAVAIGIKHGDTYAGYYERVQGRIRYLYPSLTVAMGLVVALGEFAALRAIARGSGNHLEAEMVWGAIHICLLLIVIELLEPFGKTMKRPQHKLLLMSICVLWMVTAIYVALIIYGIVPL
ncbi:hypothetical protein J7I84_01945 [Arthrobacter sp. ISL-85]|uniref:hypothetical protein n=1 Tax=Arthrobacter sp. ISL-85 TaxID=2819115 RepID=UPI001BEC66EB|nr:hypothetical protein [Arthrobacter sp. ISL-85]MBT2565269.1 hypothetical protein [Arthrobacter sp. ISL-85]